MPRDIGIRPGDSFHRLTVLQKIEDKELSDGKHKSQYLCRCGCPAQTLVKVTGVNLKSGNVKSCGCLRREHTKEIGLKNRTYGISTEKIAQVYYNLLYRAPDLVCPSWKVPGQGIKNFYDDMSSTYIDGARLRRINPLYGFSPENCYWSISSIAAQKTGFNNAVKYH